MKLLSLRVHLRGFGTNFMSNVTEVISYVLICSIAVIAVSTSTLAQTANDTRSAILMPGKKTLYQRVLTRPEAILRKVPSKDSAGSPLPAFSIYFVYDRKKIDDIDWIEVGQSSNGSTVGWITRSALIDWKQSIVVAFTNSAGRNRLPIFRNRNFVLDMLESEQAVKKNDEVLAKIALGLTSSSNFEAVSIEPANYIDIRKQFYLLPILEAKEIFFADGFSTRLLKIASVTQKPKNTGGEPANDKTHPSQSGSGTSATVAPRSRTDPVNKQATREFKTGIAFVIDGTISMGPYIDRTRDAVRRLSKSILEVGSNGQIQFALVGFRDTIKAVPALEYVSKVFADFSLGVDPSKFLARAEAFEAAKVSSPGFIEDSYSGVLKAVNDLNWDKFAARYIILITDAGPRDSNDPLSETGIDAARLRLFALDKGIAIYTLHLLTREGRRNHASAQAKFSELSRHPKGDLYYAIKAGSSEQLGKVIEIIATNLAKQIELVASNQSSEAEFKKVAEKSVAKGDKDIERLEREAVKVGYAMKLAYLGRVEGTQAPSIFEGWIADRDVSHPDVPALEVRMLLSKNQLSDLQESLRAIIAAGEKGQISPENFFDEIRSAALLMPRTPKKLRSGKFKNLAESGLLGEYLDGLPYKSKVMNVSLELWSSWSIGEQQAFLDELSAKINLYEKYHDDVDRWITLTKGESPGDAVYPIPLDALP